MFSLEILSWSQNNTDNWLIHGAKKNFLKVRVQKNIDL